MLRKKSCEDATVKSRAGSKPAGSFARQTKPATLTAKSKSHGHIYSTAPPEHRFEHQTGTFLSRYEQMTACTVRPKHTKGQPRPDTASPGRAISVYGIANPENRLQLCNTLTSCTSLGPAKLFDPMSQLNAHLQALLQAHKSLILLDKAHSLSQTGPSPNRVQYYLFAREDCECAKSP